MTPAPAADLQAAVSEIFSSLQGEGPRAGERHYCGECRRRKVPQRDAARDYRKSQ